MVATIKRRVLHLSIDHKGKIERFLRKTFDCCVSRFEASGYRALSDGDNPRRQKVMPAEVHSVWSRLFMVNGET